MTGDVLNELYRRAQKAHQAGRFEAARDIGLEMEKAVPSDPRTWLVLAQSALGLKDYTEAAKYLLALHERDPENQGFRHQLAEVYRAVGYFEEAVEMYRPVFESAEKSLAHYTYFGTLCSYGGAEAEGRACFKKAAEMKPGDADIRAALARVELALGENSEAEKNIAAALSIDPGHIETLSLKVDTGAALSESERGALLKASENQGVHLGRRVDAAFAYARALDREKKYDAAFPAFERANALARKFFEDMGQSYSPKAEREAFKARTTLFTQAFLETLVDPGPSRPTPIFIIGLPRSGTTLVEQILSAHPEIAAGGELRLLGEFPMRLSALISENPGTPEADLVRAVAPDWRAEYQALLQKIGRESRFVTDKMPMNFPHVGLAATLFPDARFIFLEREAMDNCLSMFLQPLAQSYAAATSLESAADFYLLFQDYLAFWRGLKGVKVYNLSYETLAGNFTAEAKKLIDFLGLPWDEACLDFHKTGGPVRTLSMQQVREPVSGKYVGRWKHYEAFLHPLKKALGHKD